MTRDEFILKHIAFEKGMIFGLVHQRNFLNMVIKAHRKEATKKRGRQLADMNTRLINGKAWREVCE